MIKNIVSTDHVYSAIFYRIIVFEVSYFENVGKFLQWRLFSDDAGSRRRTYLELQLRTRTYSKQSPVFKVVSQNYSGQ